MSSKQKKKWRPMLFYVIWDDAGHYVFANKSTNAPVSVRHHFHRAYNPLRADYNSEFYTWLRSRPQEDFYVTYCEELPECIERRAHLCVLPQDAVLPPIIDYEDLYTILLERKEKEHNK